MSKIKALFVTRRATRCGIADYGKRVYSILTKSSRLELVWGEVDNEVGCLELIRKHRPDAVLYNYCRSVLPWVVDSFVAPLRAVPQIAIYHEANLAFHPDAIIDIDSTKADIPDQFFFVSPRPLFEGLSFGEQQRPPFPIIGSFGFGFPDKNFPLIAFLVCTQFDRARIRLNIPFAEYGDAAGLQARGEVEKVKSVIASLNPSIELEVSHQFLEQEDMLAWLHANDLNLFLYDRNENRSLSSTIDYALSVRKPIGISSSVMFRHLHHVTPSILVTQTSLPQLIRQGIEPLKALYQTHSHQALIDKYEYALTRILHRTSFS